VALLANRVYRITFVILVFSVTVESAASQNEQLRRELQQEKEDKRRLSDRMQRLQEGEQVLREGLDKMQQEATTLRLSAAHA